MKKLTSLFLFAIFLAFAMSGCGPSPSPIATLVTPTPTPVPPTATAIPPTPTSVLPTPTSTPALPTLTPVPPAPTPGPEGRTIVVTSTADSGPGTLPQALREAQSGDTITFDPAIFPPRNPITIFLKAEDHDSALPNLTQGHVTIDASDAGVILDGSRILGDWVNGLEIYSDENTVRGLQIVNFTGSALALCGGSHNTIGGDRRIGTGPLGQGNLTSKNGIGIDLCDQESFDTIKGTLIGTNPTGTEEWGNKFCGICIENGVCNTTIGPGNIIAYNGVNGISIDGPEAFGNTITQNSIHDNNSFGIRLWDGGNTMLDPPLISDFDVAIGTVTGTACANCTIEVFSDSSNEGEVYEGQTKANSTGTFTYNKGLSFTGPHLTATATDADGNTSEFSFPTYASLQEGNHLPRIRLQPKRSGELEDNRMGALAGSLWHLEPEVFPNFVLDASNILELGLKRFRLTINNLDSSRVDWSKPEFSIDPSHDEFITTLANNGIAITYVLSFWDIAYKDGGGEIPIPRFKTEDEIQRYLDFVQFIVHHFKDRIEYYEIWNEPNLTDRIQWIEVEDYINLVKRAVPVIRQEYPEAKIVVGGTSSLIDTESQTYLFEILRLDIMPLVDVVSWHPMYGSSPEYDSHRQYYYEYPSLVQRIKDTASAHGFTGEYVADEIHWNTPDLLEPPWPTYSETKSAKYLTRSIVMHLGMDVTVTQILLPSKPQLFRSNQNLSTVMAGAKSSSLPIEIQSEARNIKSYSFSLSKGDNLIALWTDGVAIDDDPGVPAMVIIEGLLAQKVVGIDVLHGFEQQLIAGVEDGNLVVHNLLVKDYPIILRLTK